MSMREQMAEGMYDDNLRQRNNSNYERATRFGYGYAPTFQKPFAQAEEPLRNLYLSYADAALDKLMDPTPAMVAHLCAETRSVLQNVGAHIDQQKAAWRAALRVAKARL